VNVLLLCGTVARASSTRAALVAVEELLREVDVEPIMWDLLAWPLPIADPVYHGHARGHPDGPVRRLLEAAEAADGFVLASPVYHNSYSGVLKNCLDHLSIEHFEYKPVGLVAYGASLSAIQVCDQLRLVVRGLRGIAVPTQVVVTPPDVVSRGTGDIRIESPSLLERYRRLVSELVLFGQVRGTAGERPGNGSSRSAVTGIAMP
jgi:azobenzene reductase